MKWGRVFLLSCSMGFFCPPINSFAANYHTVGWFNTVVPGGGQLLLGDYSSAGIQAILESGSFFAGYNNSKRAPLTLDGVPEDLPKPSSFSSVAIKKTLKTSCVKKSGKTVCTTTTTNQAISSIQTDFSETDITRSLYADLLQEFGIKYHFVNVFNSYREAAGPDGGKIGEQGIDQTSSKELFLAPFRWKNISDPWVYLPLIASTAVLFYSYNDLVTSGELTRSSPLNLRSQRLYDLTYVGIFPVGSAAPEEMFYRGFMQHEFYSWVPSPLFSVSLSSTVYAFSHSSDDRLSAGITGLFLGFLTHKDKGELSKPIAYHFWADVLAGLYQISVVRKSYGGRPVIDFSIKF